MGEKGMEIILENLSYAVIRNYLFFYAGFIFIK